jgi:hypothetical protein
MMIRAGICDDQPVLRDGLRVQLGLAATSTSSAKPATASRPSPWPAGNIRT